MKQLNHADRQLFLSILARATDLTLATLRQDGSPHASTVNFASEALVIYVAIALDSHKAHDVREHCRVALTVNAPYANWHEIQGLAIDATAVMVSDPDELELASRLLLHKLPAYAELIMEPGTLPWPGMLFLRIEPLEVQLLDYTRGIGFAQSFDLRAEMPASV